MSSPNARLGLALRARERRLELVLAVDQAHAAPAAARRRLEHHRVADARGGRLRRRGGGEPAARPAPLSPGTTGTPAACISARAAVLPPMARIADGGGPMNVAPAAATASAKSAFSDRKP